MNLLILLMFFLVLCSFTKSLAKSFNNTEQSEPPIPVARPSITPFKPGIAIIIGILTTVFSLTFLLLLYIKHCKRSRNYTVTTPNALNSWGQQPSRVNSGISRKVISSLPIFRFSSLRGSKDGLECAVCLNKFEPEEVLRLLPKCKHAFHVECVDTWLDAHSTCPLCRSRVHAEDVLLIDTISSTQVTPRTSNTHQNGKTDSVSRISGRHSSAGERGGSLEIIVESSNPKNTKMNTNTRSEFWGRNSLDGWNFKQKTWKKCTNVIKNTRPPLVVDKLSRKDGQLPVKADKHRIEHTIIIGGGDAAEDGTIRRWSDVQFADFLYLKSELIMGYGGDTAAAGRSLSEIVGVGRYRGNNGIRGNKEDERRIVKRWLDWISISQQQTNTAVVVQNTAMSLSPSSIPPPLLFS